MARKKLTPEQYQAMGQTLHEFSGWLVHASVEVGNSAGGDGKVVPRMDRIRNHMSELRSALENRAFTDWPDIARIDWFYPTRGENRGQS